MPPAAIPPSPGKVPAEPLIRYNPLTTASLRVSGARQTDRRDRPEERTDVRLLGIKPWKEGTYRAYILYENKRDYVGVGETIGNGRFSVDVIDPDAETVKLFDNDRRERITLTLPG